MDKFQFKPLKTQQFFIPSITEVSEFLGFSSSPRQLLKWLAQITNTSQHLPSNRSLDNIAKNGIKWSTIRPFIWSSIRSLYQSGVLVPKLMRPNLPPNQKTFSQLELSFIAWESCISNFIYGLKSSAPDMEIPLISHFIEQRINQYRPTSDIISNFKASSKNELDHETFISFFESFLPHTLLTDEEQNRVRYLLSKVHIASASQQQISLDITQEELKNLKPILSLFQNDFYLSLFAVFDITLLNDTQNIDTYPNGLIGKILMQESNTFLGKFFMGMKNGWKINYSDIAEYIPLPNSEFKRNGASKLDIQIERFKEWRSGKSLPSNKTLMNFFDAISRSEKFSQFNSVILCNYAILMLSLDRQAKSVPSIEMAFTRDNYQRYFKYYKKKQLQIEVAS